jgi:hypothetical protein
VWAFDETGQVGACLVEHRRVGVRVGEPGVEVAVFKEDVSGVQRGADQLRSSRGAAAATRCSGRCRWPLVSRQAGIGMGCSRQSVDVAVRVLIS